MPVNGLTKGKSGEREVCTILNDIVNRVHLRMGSPIPPVPDFQRNQNQSAVGGSDVKNPYQLAIEVKRQEQLSINTWWRQLQAAATRDKEWPILIFKQNRKPWRIKTLATLPNISGISPLVCVEIDLATFQNWVEVYLEDKLSQKVDHHAPALASDSLPKQVPWMQNAP